MSDRKVIPFRPRRAPRPGRLEPVDVLADAATLARGLLFALGVVLLGSVLVAAVLVLGVVGSPVIAVAIGWLLLRHARHPRTRTPRRLRIASA